MRHIFPVVLLALAAVVAPTAVAAADARSEQISALLAALENANVRYGASLALARHGEAAVPALRKSLASQKPDVRVWSAYTLGEIGPTAKAAVGDLIEALGSPDDELRSAAARALGKIGPAAAAAVDELASALADESEEVRRQSASALGEIGPASMSSAKQLVRGLADSRVRESVRGALIQIGPAAADSLVASLDDEQVRFDASQVLRKIDPEKAKQAGLQKASEADLPALRLVLHDLTRRPEERAEAAKSLATLESGAALLIKAFEEDQIARTAAEAFSQADSSAVPALVEAIQNDNPLIRAAACTALGQLGPDAADSVPELVKRLADDNREVRYQSVRALHEVGSQSAPAVPKLIEVVLDARELEPTRQWAIKTMIVTLPETHDAVVQGLLKASQEKGNYGVSQLARQKVREIDPEAADKAGVR